MNQPKNPFEYGGVITDLDTAIERTEIDEVTTALYRGEYVSVLAPRQSGKTTFLKQLQKRVAERHQTTAVYISFEKSAYEGGIKEVVKEFSQRVNAVANSSPGGSTAGVDLNLVDFLNSTTPKPLVFLVDELPSPADTAFRLLCEVRAYYNENSNSRHLFVFAGSIDLAEFSQTQNSFVSPFNIARTIYLKDFQEEQIKTWVTKRVGDGFFSDPVIKTVFEYTGGQPFLVQFLYSYLYSLPTNEAREAKLADIVTLIQGSQVENTPNIKTMVDKVLDTREWRNLLGQILEEPQIPFTTSNKIVRNLCLNGCISRENKDGYCQLRNPIYRAVFEENFKILRGAPSPFNNLTNDIKDRSVDFLIITPMGEEFEAVLSKFSDSEKIRFEQIDDYQYRGSVKCDNGIGYNVVISCLHPLKREIGPLRATSATTRWVEQWQPSNLLLVGTAAGVKGGKVHLGDILIPAEIRDVTETKRTDNGEIVIPKQYSFDKELFDKCKVPNWEKLIATISRPEKKSKIALHTGGCIISGGSKMEVEDWTAFYDNMCEKLHGLEMEASGVMTALDGMVGKHKPKFMMIRAVSDFGGKNRKEEQEKWEKYACKVAAAYTYAFLKSGPVPVLNKSR